MSTLPQSAAPARAPRTSSRPPLPPGYIACACGKAYSPAAWRRLILVGLMDDGLGGELELRNCTCGSTRAVQVEGGRS